MKGRFARYTDKRGGRHMVLILDVRFTKAAPHRLVGFRVKYIRISRPDIVFETDVNHVELGLPRFRELAVYELGERDIQ